MPLPMGTPPIPHPHPHPHPPGPPTAAEITRRINSKRRRDDDLDPVSIKRRAVSPGMSVHNSPVMQSPLQRDMAPWGASSGHHHQHQHGGSMSSRPGSVGGESVGGAGAGAGGAGKNGGGNGNGNGSGGGSSDNGSAHGAGGSNWGGGKVRVGFQGMVETNDGITRLSIE
jgi:D-3-phosphoglycerate dehydrogenase